MIKHQFFKPIALTLFLLLFLKEFLFACFNLLKLIYFPPKRMKSGFIEIPLTVKRPWQRLIISHFITLTPGTLTVDILPSNTLLLHLIDLRDQESTIRLVHQTLEPLLKALGGRK